MVCKLCTFSQRPHRPAFDSWSREGCPWRAGGRTLPDLLSVSDGPAHKDRLQQHHRAASGRCRHCESCCSEPLSWKWTELLQICYSPPPPVCALRSPARCPGRCTSCPDTLRCRPRCGRRCWVCWGAEGSQEQQTWPACLSWKPQSKKCSGTSLKEERTKLLVHFLSGKIKNSLSIHCF